MVSSLKKVPYKPHKYSAGATYIPAQTAFVTQKLSRPTHKNVSK